MSIVNQTGESGDPIWVDKERLEVISDIEFEIDFKNGGAITTHEIFCKAWEIRVINHVCAETPQNGNGVIECNDLRPIGDSGVDEGTWDSNSRADQGIWLTCSDIVRDCTVGKRNCGRVIILRRIRKRRAYVWVNACDDAENCRGIFDSPRHWTDSILILELSQQINRMYLRDWNNEVSACQPHTRLDSRQAISG